MASFLKRHKGLIIFITIVMILFILMFLFVRSIFQVGEEGTLYGNRLNGIEKVKLNEDTLNKIVTDIKKYEQVTSASYRLEGKILNFLVDVKSDTTLESAKKLSDPILSALSEAEKSFYDIQVIITCNKDEKNEIYPVIGYKHKTSSEFVW